jgi:hypothetical protein
VRTGDGALSDPRPVRFARLRLGRMLAAGGHHGKVWLWEPGTDRAATFRAYRLYL